MSLPRRSSAAEIFNLDHISLQVELWKNSAFSLPSKLVDSEGRVTIDPFEKYTTFTGRSRRWPGKALTYFYSSALNKYRGKNMESLGRGLLAGLRERSY